MTGRSTAWGARAAAAAWILALLTASASAATGHPHGPATAAGIRDILLGAGAATLLMAGMAAAIAASWRGFRAAIRTPADTSSGDPFDWRDAGRD